jgi:hypothetical protein
VKILVCRDGCGPLNVESADPDVGITCPKGHYDPVELDLAALFYGDSAIAYGKHAGKYPLQVIEAAVSAPQNHSAGAAPHGQPPGGGAAGSAAPISEEGSEA